MPLLFLVLSCLAVGAMMATGATTAKQLPPGPPPIQMQPGEVWAVSGAVRTELADDQWVRMHDDLSRTMTWAGARMGKLVHEGTTFAFQVQPLTQPMTLHLPMVEPSFTVTKALKLQATSVSGVPRTMPRTRYA
jgi:hypothetical protein